MKRGGRGSNLRGPWRRLDEPAIASAEYLNRGRTARNCVCVMVLAACSMAMSILIWSSRYHSNAHQLSSSGMVFPLYHYSRSDGHGMKRRENRTRRGRGIQGADDVLMTMLGGRRLNFDDINQFYIEMKLGNPPVKYKFQADTGSHLSWVYCHTRISKLTDWGPSGLYVPEDTSFVSCAGDTQALCQQLQQENACRLNGGVEPCVSTDNYACRFTSDYEDGSISSGYVVNASFTVTLEDKSERNLFGSLGCCMWQQNEPLPMRTDGIIGLGKCKGTLLDQWTTSKSIRQSVLGVCLAKGVHWNARRSPAMPVGYISMGMDFKEKFHKSNSVWAKLTTHGDEECFSAINLLSVSGLFGASDLAFHSPVLVLLDTGSGGTFFATNVYEPLLGALDHHATSLGFPTVADGRAYAAKAQRVCWQTPDLSLAKGSPIQEFPDIVFEFEGIDSASQQDASQYLVIDPADYLIWDAITKKLCATILHDEDCVISIIGADMMREHLYVYDFENQRVRWTSDKCKLK